jgi:hypothetical protein
MSPHYIRQFIHEEQFGAERKQLSVPTVQVRGTVGCADGRAQSGTTSTNKPADATITILDIIHRPVNYLKRTVDHVRTSQKTHHVSATIPTG